MTRIDRQDNGIDKGSLDTDSDFPRSAPPTFSCSAGLHCRPALDLERTLRLGKHRYRLATCIHRMNGAPMAAWGPDERRQYFTTRRRSKQRGSEGAEERHREQTVNAVRFYDAHTPIRTDLIYLSVPLSSACSASLFFPEISVIVTQ